jgi:hypothetical protein
MRTISRERMKGRQYTRADADRAEAAQAWDAGGSGHGDVEGEEGRAALGLAAADADGLLGPQGGDEPAMLLAALLEAPCRLEGQQRHRVIAFAPGTPWRCSAQQGDLIAAEELEGVAPKPPVANTTGSLYSLGSG